MSKRVVLIGKNKDDIMPLIEAKGFELVDSSPELIITYGGDGAFLEAEREFPDTPKLPIRDSRTAPLCPEHSEEKILDDFLNGKFQPKKLLRLEGRCANQNHMTVITGINDIFIHNIERYSSIRYRIFINDSLYLSEVASDCVGFATPHGSTAYFQSITNCIFEHGIGIAFSNSREHVNHIIVPEDSKIKVEILRGPALLVADNNPEHIELNQYDTIIVGEAPKSASVYGLEVFMCVGCRKLRHLKI